MEKSCENCRKNRCDAVTFTLCMDPEPYKDWQPDYQTLEAELEQYKEALEQVDYWINHFLTKAKGGQT